MQLVKAMKDYKDYIDLNTKDLVTLRVGNWLLTGNIEGLFFKAERGQGLLDFDTYTKTKVHIEIDLLCDQVEGVPLNERE